MSTHEQLDDKKIIDELTWILFIDKKMQESMQEMIVDNSKEVCTPLNKPILRCSC